MIARTTRTGEKRHQLNIPLTADERRQIEEEAKKARLSMAELIRSRTLGKLRRERPKTPIRKRKAQVSGK